MLSLLMVISFINGSESDDINAAPETPESSDRICWVIKNGLKIGLQKRSSPFISIRGYTLLNKSEAIEVIGNATSTFVDNGNKTPAEQLKATGREAAKTLIVEKMINALLSPRPYDALHEQKDADMPHALVVLFAARQTLRYVCHVVVDTAFNTIEKAVKQ